MLILQNVVIFEPPQFKYGIFIESRETMQQKQMRTMFVALHCKKMKMNPRAKKLTQNKKQQKSSSTIFLLHILLRCIFRTIKKTKAAMTSHHVVPPFTSTSSLVTLFFASNVSGDKRVNGEWSFKTPLSFVVNWRKSLSLSLSRSTWGRRSQKGLIWVSWWGWKWIRLSIHFFSCCRLLIY